MKKPISSPSWRGKSSSESGSAERRSAEAVIWSVPGARPMPRSIRAGIERLEHPELLGDDERRVVRQHHAAGADSDRLGLRGERGGEDRGRRARDPGHVVVLGDPVAVIAEPLDLLGEVDRVRQRLVVARALADDGEIEDGELGAGMG